MPLIAVYYQDVYRKWAQENDFQSRLPGDVKKRKAALESVKQEQASLDAHLKELPKKERVYAYSELAFKRAAIEWMISTDQVSTIVIHDFRLLLTFV